MLSFVLVDPEIVGLHLPPCELRRNKGDMPLDRHHGMGTVRAALERRARVCVYVRDHGEPGITAHLPERPVSGPVEDDNARIETARIEVVVINEAKYPPSTPVIRAKEERSAFAHAFPAALKFREPFGPKPPKTGEPVIRGSEPPYNRPK